MQEYRLARRIALVILLELALGLSFAIMDQIVEQTAFVVVIRKEEIVLYSLLPGLRFVVVMSDEIFCIL